MGGAYPVATLLTCGAMGLVIVLAIALIVAGTLVREEKRQRFLAWSVAAYMAAWTLFVLYNTVVLTRYFFRIMR